MKQFTAYNHITWPALILLSTKVQVPNIRQVSDLVLPDRVYDNSSLLPNSLSEPTRPAHTTQLISWREWRVLWRSDDLVMRCSAVERVGKHQQVQLKAPDYVTCDPSINSDLTRYVCQHGTFKWHAWVSVLLVSVCFKVAVIVPREF